MATFTVTTLADSGTGSLREAITLANGNGNSGTTDNIVFQSGLSGTIRLTSSTLQITQDLTIEGDNTGDGKADITISGDKNNNGQADLGDLRIFEITGATTHTELRSLTLTNGYIGSFGGGGAVWSGPGATTRIIASTLSDNHADYGGAVFNYNGTLEIINSTLVDNRGYLGGAVGSDGTSSQTGLVGSTLYHNTADFGGGVFAQAGSMYIVSSTIVGNASTTVSTLFETNAGGVTMKDAAGDLYIVNSVIAGNTSNESAHNDVSGNGNIFGYSNFFGGAAGVLASTLDHGGSNLYGAVPVGSLGFHGGPVQTMAVASNALISAGGALYLPQDTGDVDKDSVTTGEALPLDANGRARVSGTLDIGAVEADSLTVTTVNDSGANVTFASDFATDVADGSGLSLREALHWASAGDKIVFASGLAGSTVRLTSQLVLSQDITINGDTNGDDKADITISGDNDSNGKDPGDVRLFSIQNSGTEVTFESLTLTGGYASGGGGAGGAINGATGTSVYISNSSLLDNTTASNGFGGAIYSKGFVVVVNSLFAGNQAYSGGAIHMRGGDVALLNTTMTQNTATSSGGAIDTASGADISLYSSTITGNTALNGGGLVLGVNSDLKSRNSVVAANTSSNASTKDMYDLGATSKVNAANSYLGNEIVIDTDGGQNLRGSTPGLGPLADNGGAVKTMAILTGSALIDAGDNSSDSLRTDTFDLDNDGNPSEITPVDGRGAPRIFNSTVDIGAFEKLSQSDHMGSIGEDDVSFAIGVYELANDAAGAALVGFRSGSEAAGGAFGTDVIHGVYGWFGASGGALAFQVDSAATQALAQGQTVTDTFTYKISVGGHFDTAQVSVEVVGANDAPVINSNGSGATAALSVAENTTAVTTVTSTDVDAGSTRTYAKMGADAALFAIDTSTGALTFIAGRDFETPADSNGDGIYQVTVRATDNGGLTDDQALSVTVTNAPGHTITGNKTKGDKIDGSHPSGNAATNEEDNINGRGGNDTINAMGGNDTVKGGTGKDVLDGGAGNRDLVDYSDMTKSVELTLKGSKPATAKVGGAADDTVKNFESIMGGKAGDKLTGDGQANLLNGGAGNDVLNGGKGIDTLKGGLGSDKLTGGKDTLDYFVFDSKLEKSSFDTIVDFKHTVDKLALDDAIFKTIGPTLEAGELLSKAGATKAKQLDDHLIYDTKTGILLYDADGSAKGAAIHIATLTAHPALSIADVLIV